MRILYQSFARVHAVLCQSFASPVPHFDAHVSDLSDRDVDSPLILELALDLCSHLAIPSVKSEFCLNARSDSIEVLIDFIYETFDFYKLYI